MCRRFRVIQFRVNIKGVSFIIFFYIINLFVVYRIFTSMIGKKTNVPLVKKDLRDHKVIYLYMITCIFLFYPNMA